jgi:HD-GYP domain-containing protein (c-di-GMP phosphodiesterase class II)
MCDVHPHDAVCTAPALDVNAFLDEIVVAVSNARIYRPDHPRVTTSITTLAESLEERLSSKGVDRLEIGTADGFLFHERRPLLGASLSAPRIVQPLRKLRSGGLAFLRGAEHMDFQALVSLLSARRLDAETPDEANAALLQRGGRRVRFLPAYRSEDLVGDARASTVAVPEMLDTQALLAETLGEAPREVYQGTVDLLQDAAIGAARGDELALDPARATVERLLKRVLDDAGTMLGLARYERYDEFTFGHSIRVCLLTLQLASTLTKDMALLNRLGLAALLHDIGKARVPFEILHARGRLDADERLEMTRHSEHGAAILLGMPDAEPLAVTVAFGHHRTQGREGYPRTADEARLSVATRLIKICDVYEALTAVRPYKARMSPVRSYRIMMGMKGHFDEALLRRFIGVNGIYPVGMRVRLGSGEIARVRRQTGDVERPVVEIEVSANGTRLRSGRRPERDLTQDDGTELFLVRELLLDDAS